MKTYSVLVVLMLFASGFVLTGLGDSDGDAPIPVAMNTAGAESSGDDFDPEPVALFENDPMTLYMNARRADRGPFYLGFYQVERGVSSVASILHGEDYARTFQYPFQSGQRVSSAYDENLEATLDVYVNSMDVPGKIVHFKAIIDRNGDGINDTVIDFVNDQGKSEYMTQHNASPEHVVLKGDIIWFEKETVPLDMAEARIFLKVWRSDTIDDTHNRLKVYCGFLSDTEMNLQSKLILPWVNPVPHVEMNEPFDHNLTGVTYFHNTPIKFDGTGSRDPSGEALGYVWTFDSLEYKPVYDKSEFNLSFKEPGWYTITLNVSNSLYFTNETSVTIRVIYKNHPPVITVQSRNVPGALFKDVPNEVNTYTFVNTEWRVIVEDIDEDPLTVHWDFDDGFTSTSLYVNHSYKSPGTYVLEVEVFDGNETSGRVKVTKLIRVEPNHSPIPVIVISGPAVLEITPPRGDDNYRGMEYRVNLGDSIIFDATKSYDPDKQVLKTWSRRKSRPFGKPG